MTTDTRSFSDMANGVFDRCVADYHVTDNIDAPVPAPYPAGSLAATRWDYNRFFCTSSYNDWELNCSD